MKVPSPIVLATANEAKAAELSEALRGNAALRGIGQATPHSVGPSHEAFTVLTRPPDAPEVDETAQDFEGNARLKAAALSEAIGCATVADDSGLEVDHLDGAPGVRSARYAGDDADDAANLAKLIDALKGLHEDDPGRRARFRCVIVLMAPGSPTVTGHGVVEGRIIAEPRGSHGFGYDPVFVPDDGDGRTFAEMTSQEKLAISHRGRALQDLVANMAGV